MYCHLSSSISRLCWPCRGLLIPGEHAGLREVCGLHYLTGTPAAVFAVTFHILFWPLCGLLIVFGKALPSTALRILSVLLITVLVLTIYGCCPAIDAVRH